MTQQQWTKDTTDRHEQVRVVRAGDYESRQEVVEDVASARYQTLSKLTQLVWLLFGILEALIALRIFLKLIAANPASVFANLVYSFTDLFLWPFFGLTSTPSLGGMVLEIPSIVALIIYALIAWVIVKVLWLLFYRTPTRSVTTYEEDQTIR